MSEMQQVRLDEMRGSAVFDREGDKIGSVEEIYYDEQSNRPEFVGIGKGFFGTKRLLVPLQGATVENDEITVAYDKEFVKDSPDIDGETFSYDDEQELLAYYSVGGNRTADSTTPAGQEQELVRSEEELRVGKADGSAGSVRLRKWVETEPVSMQVELRRETARVVREDINEPIANDTHAFEEQEVEVPLHAEEAVVEKQTVAKERIAIEKDVTTDTETIEGEVRKERVEIEQDDPEGGTR